MRSGYCEGVEVSSGYCDEGVEERSVHRGECNRVTLQLAETQLNSHQSDRSVGQSI